MKPDPPDDEEEEPFQNLVENLPVDNDSDEDIPHAIITAKISSCWGEIKRTYL
jgi:hypothetical protein